VNDETLMF